jgi:hypothetical protein
MRPLIRMMAHPRHMFSSSSLASAPVNTVRASQAWPERSLRDRAQPHHRQRPARALRRPWRRWLRAIGPHSSERTNPSTSTSRPVARQRTCERDASARRNRCLNHTGEEEASSGLCLGFSALSPSSRGSLHSSPGVRGRSPRRSSGLARTGRGPTASTPPCIRARPARERTASRRSTTM